MWNTSQPSFAEVDVITSKKSCNKLNKDHQTEHIKGPKFMTV